MFLLPGQGAQSQQQRQQQRAAGSAVRAQRERLDAQIHPAARDAVETIPRATAAAGDGADRQPRRSGSAASDQNERRVRQRMERRQSSGAGNVLAGFPPPRVPSSAVGPAAAQGGGGMQRAASGSGPRLAIPVGEGYSGGRGGARRSSSSRSGARSAAGRREARRCSEETNAAAGPVQTVRLPTTAALTSWEGPGCRMQALPRLLLLSCAYIALKHGQISGPAL